MSKEYILDNLSCQEIKELINKKEISLNDLDTAALEKLFDYETDLICTDEGDTELMNACAKRLDELNGPLMSEEHFWAVINKAEAIRVSAPEKAEVNKTKKVFPAKRILVIAAAIAVIAAIATVTASAFGLEVFEYFKEVIGLSAGERIDKDTVTLINNGKLEKYSSVEAMMLNQKIDTYYPSVMPNGTKIEKVHISTGTNGGELIEFITSDPATYVSIDTGAKDVVIEDYTEELNINGCTYYIYKGENFAVSYHNDCYYYISSDSYDNLVLIIKNMKEK